MSNANTDALRQAYKEWHDSKGGSVDRWLELMTDNVDFRSLSQGQYGLEFTCSRCSKTEVGSYFEGLKADFEMIHYTVDRFVTEGDTVVMIGRTAWRHRVSGKSFDTPKVDIVTFNGSKISAFSEFYDTAMVQAAAMAG